MAVAIASQQVPATSRAYVAPLVKKPVVVMVKHEHIGLEDQIKLIDAGIVHPVDSKAYLGYLGDDVNVISSKTVYVPHIGDRLVDVIHDQPLGSGNPLASENQNDMCLVITPPIQGFDYDKFANGNVLYPKHFGCLDPEIYSDPVSAVRGYLPENFVENAQHVKAMTLQTLAQLTRQDAPFEVVGAKLNPLSSGLGNIVLFVKFSGGCPFNSQTYVPIYGTNMKVRIVPKPFITKNSSTKMYNIEVGIKVQNPDAGLFDSVYKYASSVIERDLKGKLKHVRTNKSDGSMIIAGHSLKPFELSASFQKALKKTIVQAFLEHNYFVSDVSFKTFENY
jgi:hypothetical protein